MKSRNLIIFSTLAAVSALSAETSDWFPYTPKSDHSTESAIGLGEEWNSQPAGAHGYIEQRGDKLFYNGEEIKLWGTNIGYDGSNPDRETAQQLVNFYTKYGINALRHHKHLDGPKWAGFQSDDSFLEFVEAELDEFDYFNHLLKESGIFWKHSPTFGVKFGPGDTDRIPYWQDFGEFNRINRIRAPFGAIYLSRELQDMQIEQTIKLLDHTNPYTGMRYADDPALFCVEFFNEDSALFGGTNLILQRSPTLRQRTGEKFAQFLMDKYGSEKAWREAWGERVIVSNPENIGFNHLANLIKPDEV
ncbi:MAG: hypothetical protein ACFB21_08650, partial [Opitutales bacterium]